MLRDVGLEDISDGRLYRENDMVKTDTNSCQGCKKICCIGMGRTIVLDYIGAGDAYCAGIIYSFINDFDPQKAVEFSNAASCLKHTVSGDYNLVSVDEVMKLAFAKAGNEVSR